MAIKKGNEMYSLLKPARHDDIIRSMVKVGKLTTGTRGLEFGFILSDGEFVSRTEAITVAIESGQLKCPKASNYLMSQDLW